MSSPYNYIAIEGNIGAGKTTLSAMLAKSMKAKLVLEAYAENPFLPSFYREPSRFGFQVELSFLAERYQQLNADLMRRNLFEPLVISDYIIQKCLMFAAINLDVQTFKLYKSIYKVMVPKPPLPDLLIYLHCPVDSLLRNIAKRGRPYETLIDAAYLKKIEKEYFKFLRQIKGRRVIIIETEGENIDTATSFEAMIGLVSKPLRPELQIISLQKLLQS
jgi:deoxyadenosine/deoxycytidine kinase